MGSAFTETGYPPTADRDADRKLARLLGRRVELDRVAIELDLVEIIKAYCVLPRRFGEPPSSPSAVAKKTPPEPVIDHLTNGGPVNGAEMADVGRTVFSAPIKQAAG